MNTLVCFIYSPFEELSDVCFFVLDGDYSHLNHVFVNSGVNPKLEEDLVGLLYDTEYNFKFKGSPTTPDPSWKWDRAILCGFLK